MDIVVVGAGQVGTAVAKGLDEVNQIAVIDRNPDRLAELRSEADVLTLEGDGANIDILREAGIEDADMLIASTDDDQTNIVVCATLEVLNPNIFNIARVRSTEYLESWRHSRHAFNVDFMVASEHLAARGLSSLALHSLTRDVEYFGRGKIEMAEFEIPADSDLAGRAIRDTDPRDGLRYVALVDGEEFEIATGDTILEPGTRIIVLGLKEVVRQFGYDLAGGPETQPERVFILGGTEIGERLASILARDGVHPKIVERDPERAHELAQSLPNCLVLNDDPTNPGFLESEGLPEAEIVLTTGERDEINFLAAHQADMLGGDRILSVVHERRHLPLFERGIVESAVHPREEVVEEIFRHTRHREIGNVAFVEQHRGEILEVELEADSILTGRPLHESVRELPSSVVIGALYRDGHVIIPDGDTVPGSGDEVIVFLETELADRVVEKL
jgi:trk system potassium uptake protein TrkA